MIIQVMKRGDVYKVPCPKWKENKLIVSCHDCPNYKGYDSKSNTIQCGEVAA